MPDTASSSGSGGDEQAAARSGGSAGDDSRSSRDLREVGTSSSATSDGCNETAPRLLAHQGEQRIKSPGATGEHQVHMGDPQKCFRATSLPRVVAAAASSVTSEQLSRRHMENEYGAGTTLRAA